MQCSCGCWFEKEPYGPSVKRMAPRHSDKDVHPCRMRQYEKGRSGWIALVFSALQRTALAANEKTGHTGWV
jgi:hypothetical protein